MKGILHNRYFRSGMMMLCIFVFLFGYVNSSMFLHSHRVHGTVVLHSHISGKAHRSDHSAGGHTAAQFLLLNIVNHAAYTEEAFEVFELEPFCPLEAVMAVLPASAVTVAEWLHPSLRAPPVLD
ncbi:MAG: hypothetical protein IJQ69_06860 [Bacteroidales bacterium]|nr:hypothetical protein [Bacteroidales bacterium]